MKLWIGSERASPQPFDQRVVNFHGPHLARALEQTSSEKPQAGADLDDLVVRAELEEADDRLDHPLVNQKMLPQSLLGPECRLAQRSANFFVKGHVIPWIAERLSL